MDALIRHRRMMRLRHAVAAGHGSCRHRHADGGREAAERRRTEPHRPRARSVRRASLAMEEHVRRVDRAPIAPSGRIGRLAARQVHHGSAALAGGDRSVRAALPRRADLSRQAAGELGSGAQDRSVGFGSGRRGGTGQPVASALSAVRRRRLPRRRDHPAGDHVGRYGRRGASRRRTLPAFDRPASAPAARGARHPHHRRRLCRSGVRQRLRQDHARARFQRLRSRPAARSAADQHHDAGQPRSTTMLQPPIADSTAASRARASSPISMPWASSSASSLTNSRCRAAIAATPCWSRC